MLPTSWIIFFDSGLKGLYDWFCRRSCWRARRSGWFSIFWINSRTLVLCACFTTECGSPGIRKSMSASFTIIDSITGLSVRLRSVSSPTLNVLLSWTERVWELSDTVITSCVITGLSFRSRIGFRIGWFDWKLLDSCSASDRWACSEPHSLFPCFKEIFGGGRGDMYIFSYNTSPVSILTTFGVQ